MPLPMDPLGGGTELDGSRSLEYCSHCYQDGKFTANLTVDEMMALVRGKLAGMNLPPQTVDAYVLEIPTLRRWSGT
jgi:hypothetical protein